MWKRRRHNSYVKEEFSMRIKVAMTINKSQGQSFNHVGVYLPTPIFSYDQLYVAISR
jgi:ATP-dependent DNA helicase PIF1